MQIIRNQNCAQAKAEVCVMKFFTKHFFKERGHLSQNPIYPCVGSVRI